MKRPLPTITNWQDGRGGHANYNKRAYSMFLSDHSLDGSGKIYVIGNWVWREPPTHASLTPRVRRAIYHEEWPSPRYISNRIYNDETENIFSERDVTHWGFVGGQFVDHTIGLRQVGNERVMIPFDMADPLESFENDMGVIAFDRSAAAPGTGVTSPREQINTVSSYIDAFAVYSGSEARLDWLRVGPLDGDPSNNSAKLLTEDGYLPTICYKKM